VVKNYKIKAAVPGYFFTLQFLILSLKKRVSIVMPITKIISLFVFITGLLFLSCNPAEPGNAPTGLEFKAEDASCTEACLTLKANNIAGKKYFIGGDDLFVARNQIKLGQKSKKIHHIILTWLEEIT